MNEKLAKEIKSCEDCPLYQNDCKGSWSSSAYGIPIEPPCCNWEENDVIFEGMYDYE